MLPNKKYLRMRGKNQYNKEETDAKAYDRNDHCKP